MIATLDHPSICKYRMNKSITLMFLLLSPFIVVAQTSNESSSAPPSEEMLEFLADWESVDHEIWEVLEHHALEDVSATAEVNH